MKLNMKHIVAVLTVVLLAVGFAAGQKLRNGSAASGIVGGEGHQKYYIYARKGQTITLQITRRVPRGGNFNLTVSRKANFADAAQVRFGRETSSRKTLVWTGKVPATGNYYFYLTGYTPSEPFNIPYRLRVTVR